MDDYIYRGRIDGLDIAFSICLTTAMVQNAVLRHDCDPVSAHLLGRALTAGLLAADLLGENERINLHWEYQGNLRTLIVDAGSDATARGLIFPTDLSACGGDIKALYGEAGRLHVVRSNNERIVGSSTATSFFNEIVEDLTYVLSTSDQVETGLSVMIGFNRDITQPINVCQGLLIRALPECDLACFDSVRRRLEEPEVRDLLRRKSESDNYFENVINALVYPIADQPRIQIDHCGIPRFLCTCNREKMAAVLRAIPEPDRHNIITQKNDVVIHCRFCRTRYILTVEEGLSIWQPTGQN